MTEARSARGEPTAAAGGRMEHYYPAITYSTSRRTWFLGMPCSSLEGAEQAAQEESFVNLAALYPSARISTLTIADLFVTAAKVTYSEAADIDQEIGGLRNLRPSAGRANRAVALSELARDLRIRLGTLPAEEVRRLLHLGREGHGAEACEAVRRLGKAHTYPLDGENLRIYLGVWDEHCEMAEEWMPGADDGLLT